MLLPLFSVIRPTIVIKRDYNSFCIIRNWSVSLIIIILILWVPYEFAYYKHFTSIVIINNTSISISHMIQYCLYYVNFVFFTNLLVFTIIFSFQKSTFKTEILNLLFYESSELAPILQIYN